MFAREANTPPYLIPPPFPSIQPCVLSKMFYQGDLQSGISKAVQEAKLVACFVTGKETSDIVGPPLVSDMCLDDGEESQLWETEFLQDEAVSLLIT
jgi:hypothetical protein